MDMAGAITRQTLVLNHMLDGFKGQMNMSKYAKIAKCSNDTALRDIQALVDAGILRKNASGGRSTSYRLPDIPQRTDPVYFAANR
jgi:Fic family protein